MSVDFIRSNDLKSMAGCAYAQATTVLDALDDGVEVESSGTGCGSELLTADRTDRNPTVLGYSQE